MDRRKAIITGIALRVDGRLILPGMPEDTSMLISDWVGRIDHLKSTPGPRRGGPSGLRRGGGLCLRAAYKAAAA